MRVLHYREVRGAVAIIIRVGKVNCSYDELLALRNSGPSHNINNAYVPADACAADAGGRSASQASSAREAAAGYPGPAGRDALSARPG